MADSRRAPVRSRPPCRRDCAALLDPLAFELGDRRDRGSAAARALAGVGRPGLRAAAADQRDAGRAELALLGAERDGHRSDLHRRRGHARFQGRRWACRAGGRRARRGRRGATCARVFATRRCVRRKGARPARGVRSLRRARSARAARRARRRSTPSSSAKDGGWQTTRSSAPCTTSTAARYWREWDAPLRDRQPEALAAARARLALDGPLLPVLPVDCRCPVAAGAARLWSGRRLRRLSVHGQRPQRRRVGAAARVPSRRVGRRAAGAGRHRGAGLGPAAVPLGRHGPGGLCLA